MQLIIFMGLQASGKSTFYRETFIDSHIRLNLDMLKTRHREKILFNACLEAKQPMVIDNTNPTLEDRKRYIKPAKEKKFQIIGYYFESKIEDCKIRNSQRQGKKVIPLMGILATAKKLVTPSFKEGFEKLFYVRIDRNYSFIIEEWQNEI